MQARGLHMRMHVACTCTCTCTYAYIPQLDEEATLAVYFEVSNQANTPVQPGQQRFVQFMTSYQVGEPKAYRVEAYRARRIGLRRIGMGASVWASVWAYHRVGRIGLRRIGLG